MARIQSLTTIPSVSNTDILAIEHNTGTGTYKVPISMLLSDVYSKSQAVAKADIVDNLDSTATDKPLAAAQGKELNDKINNKFGGMNSFTLWMGANTSFVITSEEQHQVFIITADATGGEFPFIIAGNGGVLSLGQIGSASWNSGYTKLTVNISSARTVLILSTNKINISWS